MTVWQLASIWLTVDVEICFACPNAQSQYLLTDTSRIYNIYCFFMHNLLAIQILKEKILAFNNFIKPEATVSWSVRLKFMQYEMSKRRCDIRYLAFLPFGRSRNCHSLNCWKGQQKIMYAENTQCTTRWTSSSSRSTWGKFTNKMSELRKIGRVT